MSFYSDIRLISDFLPEALPLTFDFDATFHKVAQSFCTWPVALNDHGIKINLFEWGLISDYMTTPEKIKECRNSMANARSEKILQDKKSYWYRIRNNRCIAFTTGFFEHREAGLKRKVPYFIKVQGEPLFAIAGLYNYAPELQTGEAKGTFTLITRSANTLMAKIHNGGSNAGRMPLMLTKELALQWLNPFLDESQMNGILNYEIPSENLEAWPVKSVRVRKDDNKSVIEPVAHEFLEGLG